MMKKPLLIGMIVIMTLFLLCGCIPQDWYPTQPTGESTDKSPTQEQTEPSGTTHATEESTEQATQEDTEPTEEITTATELPTETTAAPKHSALYIPGVSTDEVIEYFNEVCLDAEFVNSGDPTYLQRWEIPILYTLNGSYTDEDLDTLDRFVSWLNTVEGFPGMEETQDSFLANLRIYFSDDEEYLIIMGDHFAGTDGGITFWYNGDNQIYEAEIAYRTNVEQEIRNSVILEEIYNGLGPINDTLLREDSIIYSGFSTPQSLTEIDELMIKLLYHPEMQCGMDAEDCEAVIRQLYY